MAADIFISGYCPMNNRSFSPISHYLVRLYIDLHKLFFIALPKSSNRYFIYQIFRRKIRDEKKNYRVFTEKLCPEIEKFGSYGSLENSKILISWEVKGEVFGEIRYKGERVGFFQNEKWWFWAISMVSFLSFLWHFRYDIFAKICQ